MSTQREVLAQPAQEPVGFAVMDRPWVGLTDDEFNSIFDQYKSTRYIGALIECVEAKLKEKNT